MSADRLKQLAIALGTLVILWGIATFLRGGSDGGAEFNLPSYVEGQLTGVRIVEGRDTLDLSRVERGWTVNGYRASTSLVDGFLASLKNDSVSAELVSLSETSHSRMGVDDENGKLVTLLAGSDEIGKFVVGKRGTVFGTIYTRAPGSPETFLLRSNIVSHLFRNAEGWREHEIIAIDPSSIGSIEVARRSSTYGLSRGDSTWMFDDGVPTDSLAVARMLERFRTLQAAGFASDTDRVDLGNPDLTISLNTREGSPLVSLVFDSVDSGFWVKASSDSTIFKLAYWAVAQLAPADTLLRRH